jgi:hemophore-related protein
MSTKTRTYRMLPMMAGAAAAAALSIGGAATATAAPDTTAIVNSSCTYPQVMAALNAQDPGVAAELSASPMATGWLQNLVAAGPAQRQQMINQVQGMPRVQQYTGLISSVANSCNNY